MSCEKMKVARVRRLIQNARKRTRKNGMEQSLRVADLAPLPDRCPVLGIELDYRPYPRNPKSGNRPSVDRIDNSRGYVRGNVILVSARANVLKSDARPGELRAVADFYEDLWSLL